MNEFELLRQLGTKMSAEAEPKIDVTARVIQRIGQERSHVIDQRLSIVTIGACVLSTLAVAGSWYVNPSHDSLASLSNAAVMSTGPDALMRVFEP